MEHAKELLKDEPLKDPSTSSRYVADHHPCLGTASGRKFGRLHLPVSPACNIQCKFCSRVFNKTENRPGVTGSVLKPDDAVNRVRDGLELCPDITVVGIAGPGDTLATGHAIETFRKVDEHYPDLIKCLSTNGLLLYEKADELYEVGVRTVTVTVNAVDPVILKDIVSHVTYKGTVHLGEEGAALLIENQLKGIEKMHELGVFVKVNSVLIPGVNDGHIGEIARQVAQQGADIYNIIPLIPQHDFKDTPAPDCFMISKAKQDALAHIEIFNHCQHCRADACGVPGKKDFSLGFSEGQCAETFSHG